MVKASSLVVIAITRLLSIYSSFFFAACFVFVIKLYRFVVVFHAVKAAFSPSFFHVIYLFVTCVYLHS